MTKQTSRIIALIAFASLALGLAGCASAVIKTIITTPTQSLPLPGSPQTSSCDGVYFTWANFYTNSDGSHIQVNSGTNYITVYSSAGISPVPTSKYFVAAWDVHPPPARPTPFCITNNVQNQMYFIGSASDYYTFTVCFKDSSYNNNPLVYMVIKPMP
jgi:hypothetical protein